jgi:hypothetical protein
MQHERSARAVQAPADGRADASCAARYQNDLALHAGAFD